MKRQHHSIYIAICALSLLGVAGCMDDAGESGGSQVEIPTGPDELMEGVCGNNLVVCDGTCVHLEDDVDHCGACGNKCADSLGDVASEWICRKNACVAQACKSHYHLQDGACIEDDEFHCAGKDCTTLPGWSSGHCSEIGECEAESCVDGYQINTDDVPFCEEYKQDCDGDASICVLLNGAVEMACIEGKCVVSECNDKDYHWNSEHTSCVENNVHECGAPFVDCTNYSGWNPEDEGNYCGLNEDGVLSCIAVSCLSGYHVYGAPNAPCEPDDHDNCGEHGHACGSDEVCVNGMCEKGCSEGLQDCGGTCVDLSSSLLYCGSCDTPCTPEAVKDASSLACEDGTCKVHACNAGFHLYDNQCEADSEANCGSHGKACAGDVKCMNGLCGCAEGGMCGSVCVDFKTDKNNCGACGVVCKSHQACIGGKCGCTSGTDCGSSCVNLQNDKNNCGSCGNKCKGYQACISGKCGCPSGTDCGSGCVNPQNDKNNCGSCGNKCKGYQACISGKCGCPSGMDCGGTCVTDLKSNNNHCGACNNKCTNGTICQEGLCACPSGALLCDGKCTGAVIQGAPMVVSFLNVRSAPSSSASAVGQIELGERIFIYGYASSGTNWYRLANGYVNADYVALCEGWGNVNVDSYPLMVRTAPSTSSSAVGSIPAKQSNVCLHFKTSADGKDWYKVTWGKESGYAVAQYITVTDAIGSIPTAAGICKD